MSEQSTVHPDGWVGDHVELARARRYRTAIKWVSGLFWLLIIATWVVLFTTGDPVVWVVIIAMIWLWVGMHTYMQWKIGQIIGRKWSTLGEYKELKQLDVP
jgi:hypothetical protein